MPSGRRKKPDNFAEEITYLEAQIAETSEKLRTLKEKKKARIKEEEKNKDADKWDQIHKSGVDVNEILAYVNKQK